MNLTNYGKIKTRLKIDNYYNTNTTHKIDKTTLTQVTKRPVQLPPQSQVLKGSHNPKSPAHKVYNEITPIAHLFDVFFSTILVPG